MRHVGGGTEGEARTPLRRMGYTGRIVDAVCDLKLAAGYELAVRLLKTTPTRPGRCVESLLREQRRESRYADDSLRREACRVRSADAKP